MTFKNYLCLLFTAALLSGCSAFQSKPPTPTGNTTHEAQQAANQWQDWRATGKVSVKVDGDNTSANLNWLQSQDIYAVRLTGPFGQGGADIFGDSNSVRIEVAGEEPVSSSNPEGLMTEYFGWSLPLDNIHWWLKGVPAPNTKHQIISQLDQAPGLGRVSEFEQNGWLVSYTQFHTESPYFPRKIRISRDQVSSLMVIKDWQRLNK